MLEINTTLSDNTKRRYTRLAKQWEAWCRSNKKREFPAVPANIALFVADEQLNLSACRQLMSVLRHAHRDAELKDPTQSEEARAALREVSRRGDMPEQAAPITGEMWGEIEKLHSPQHTRDARDKALIGLMRACLLRVGEASQMNVDDIDFAEKTVLVRRSKTDQAGAGKFLHLPEQIAVHLGRWMKLLPDRGRPYSGAQGDLKCRH